MDCVITLLALAIGVLVGVVGCNSDERSSSGDGGGGSPDTPTGGTPESSAGAAPDPAPTGLLALVTSQNYRQWPRAPGYDTRRDSTGPHGGSVDIYVNDTVTHALTASGQSAWPDGSIIVKDGFQGETQRLTAIMLKRDGAWLWAEYYDTGEAFSGSVSVCSNCHRSGSDFVRAFTLP
jgi:hypothetical protein